MQVSLLLDVEKIEFWMRIQEDEFMIFGVVLNYLLNKFLVGEDLVVNLIVSEIWYTHRRLDRDRGLFFFFFYKPCMQLEPHLGQLEGEEKTTIKVYVVEALIFFFTITDDHYNKMYF